MSSASASSASHPLPPPIPPEVLTRISHTLYTHLLPPPSSLTSLDPLPSLPSPRPPTALPSSFPPPNWAQKDVFASLLALTRASSHTRTAALPELFHSLQITYPRSWLALLSILCPPDPSDPASFDPSYDPADDQALLDAQVLLAAEAAFTTETRRARSPTREDDVRLSALQHSIRTALASSPSSSALLPPALLSPPLTRPNSLSRRDSGTGTGSSRDSQSRSPSRWRLTRRVSSALESVMRPLGVYVPSLRSTRPPTHVQSISFSHFRTIHMRLPSSGGSAEKFVTPKRLMRVLREVPGLEAFGATEYVDSALEVDVLEELVLRGVGLPGSAGRVVEREERRGRERTRRPARTDVSAEKDEEPDEAERARREDLSRRAECAPLHALDLCGCVSPTCTSALTLLLSRLPSPPPALPLRRLGMHGMLTLRPEVVEAFVLLFPRLTALDLSGTLCSPALLIALAGTTCATRLRSLALARCPRLTADAILTYLSSPAAEELRELGLYGDEAFPSPLSSADLNTLLATELFRAGRLEYLDLSSAPLSAEHLAQFPLQPKLRSLGLCHIPSLPLSDISAFLRAKAPNTEILALAYTSPELGARATSRQCSMALHTLLLHPCCSVPFSISDQHARAPTRLRVVELATPVLQALGGGAPPWRVVRSRGRRGWYVDSSALWLDGAFVRSSPSHSAPSSLPSPYSVPTTRAQWSSDRAQMAAVWKKQVEMWADAGGNVGTGVGWHSRKMEVMRGEGMQGREEGLYGMVGWAYSG